MAADWIVQFDDSNATLAKVGGKGANLAKLARAGLPVPAGFLLATDAYRAFVLENQLDAHIQRVLARLRADGAVASLDALEHASAEIRAAFAAGALPQALAAAILAAFDALAPAQDARVAVRSSATAEDLPDLSFAGQQDTYLNCTRATLINAVTDCWSSLWTARAIGYRARNQIPGEGIGLAVVVQSMVQSDVSGVLFTANPLTGLRSESVIDATLGLGEALVSGQVEPDHFIVDHSTGMIRARTLGAKAVVIRALQEGGTETVAAGAGPRYSLTDAQLARLSALGVAVQELYGGVPQDIEWALADDTLYLLQARPITSLFPIPPGASSSPPSVFFSFAAVQGVFDPITPLGRDAIGMLGSELARQFDFDFAFTAVPALKIAAQRAWIDLSSVLGNGLGSRIFATLLPYVIPDAASTLESLELLGSRGKPALPSSEMLRRLRKFVLPMLRRAAVGLPNSDRRRAEAMQQIDDMLVLLEAEATRPMALQARVAFVHHLFAQVVPAVFDRVVPLFLPGMAMFAAFIKLAERAGIDRGTAFTLARGVPHNVTTEMNLALWRCAQAIATDTGAQALFVGSSAAGLAKRYLAGTLPPAAQSALQGFLKRYGMRGVAEIDMGRKRWHEDPTQVLQMVQNYLRIDDPSRAPDVVHARSRAEGEATLEIVVAALRAKGEDGAARAASFFGARARALIGLREYPKFMMIRAMGIARLALDAGYADLAARGRIANAVDGVFLHLDELRALDAGYAIDWQALVAERKSTYAREMQRTLIPDLLLGDGRAFYGGAMTTEAAADQDTLRGTPVSAGVVEGVCHVVLEPQNAVLGQGEILVCPATDPAWTPLFLSAAGLVMEVGGMMTHGSVVAREYGIPAVVGVRDATKRLGSGTRIRLNGSTGAITVLRDESADRASAAAALP